MDTIVNTRICSTCGVRKSLSEFSLKPGEKLVYESDCKSCQEEKMLDNSGDNTDNVKKEKELTDAQKYLDTPFPSKETANKTFRKLRIP